MPYSGKYKYKSRHPIKKGSGGYQGQQQRCSNTKRRTLGKIEIIADIKMIQKKQVVKETALLEEI